jgi:hypothetical protein
MHEECGKKQNFTGNPQKFHANTLEFSYCNTCKKSYAGISYLPIFMKSEGFPYEKDVVNFPSEEIATRLSGALLLK